MTRLYRPSTSTITAAMLAHPIKKIFQGEDGDFRLPVGIAPGTMIYNQRNEYVTTIPLEVGASEDHESKPVAIKHI